MFGQLHFRTACGRVSIPTFDSLFMKILGNLALGIALLLLIYPLIPNQPALRAAILRLNRGPIGPIYALFFWLMPQFLRQMLASLALWNVLVVALAAAIWSGGLDWIGVSRLSQCLLVGASCIAMTEISVLIGLTYNNPHVQIPDVVRAISPWAAWVLPLIVAGFALVTINPSLAQLLSPWVYRGPMMAAVTLALPIGGILFVRWITPPAVVTPLSE